MRWNFWRSTALMNWEASSCTLVYIVSAPSDKQWCCLLVAQRLTHGHKDSCKVRTWEQHGASFVLCYSHLLSQQMVGVQRKVDKSMNVYYRCFCSNPVHAFLVPCTMLPCKSPSLGKYQDGDWPLAVCVALYAEKHWEKCEGPANEPGLEAATTHTEHTDGSHHGNGAVWHLPHVCAA